MKKTILFFALIALINSISNKTVAQSLGLPVAVNGAQGAQPAPDSRAWTDPAMNHNKLLQQQLGEGVYKVVGNFKVMGTPFLFGEHHKGDMFTSDAKGYNIYLSYNTYNQELEFYSTSNPNKPLVREPGTVDSFIIHPNLELNILAPMKFVYGTIAGSAEKAYFKELYSGKRFSLYKRYKSELGFVSTNYIQPDLRQFDLIYDYFYSDNEKKTFKKLKANASNIIKEFKDIKDISSVFNAEEFSANQEIALQKAFDYLNQ